VSTKEGQRNCVKTKKNIIINLLSYVCRHVKRYARHDDEIATDLKQWKNNKSDRRVKVALHFQLFAVI